MSQCTGEKTRKKKAAALLLLIHMKEQEKAQSEAGHPPLQGRSRHRRQRKQRCCWVRTWLSEYTGRRQQYGHFTTLLNELKTEDEKAFYNYTRLPRGLFDEVLWRIQGRIEKRDTWYRKSLPLGLKLSITLRHLACRDGYQSLSYNLRVAPNTISLIITEVWESIKTEFAAEVIQCPTSSEEWSAIAKQFEKRWQLPHCCGALDNKHVPLNYPWNTASQYRNNMGFFSVILMALDDVDYKFLWIDIAADGSSNDASIYNMSELKEGLESEDNMFNLPEERSLPGDDVPVRGTISKRLMNPLSLRNMEFHMEFQSLAPYDESEARESQKNNHSLCDPAQSYRYPQVHSNLLHMEDQNMKLIPGEVRRFSLM